MATKDQKNQALESAIEITKAFAHSGNEKLHPAAPICESVGNLRGACQEGSSAFNGPGANACIAGVLLLISRLAGMWPQQMVEEVEEKRKIGFGIGDQQGDKQP